jgi:hypothetical protein
MIHPLRTALAFVIAATGCASVPEADWLTTLRAREADPIALESLESDDGFFRAEIPARRVGEITNEGDAYGLRIDAGSETPIDCWVYRGGVDFASSLGALSESSFDAISEGLGPIEQRQIEGVDAGVLGESPFLSVSWLYRVSAEEGPQVGEIKHVIASKGGRGLYCQQNELGYEQTFRRVVSALLASLEYAEAPEREPYFTQVSTLTVLGMRVGLERTTLTRDADGDTRVDTATSYVVPGAADTLQVTDTFGVEFARVDGALINQLHVETSNGELVSQLELNPSPDGAWLVDGTFQSRPLSTQFHSTDHPSSWLGEALALRDTIAESGVGGKITVARWIPQADPTRLLDQKMSIERRVEPDQFGAHLATAGLEADLVVDPEGSVASSSVELGSGSLEIERVYVGGEF